jgi:hypothetical protein
MDARKRYHKCLAPKDCWLDKKVIHKFDDDKHCPNCSKPNEPFNLIQDNETNAHCPKCKFSVSWTGRP